jgi:translation elongation factor EF-G
MHANKQTQSIISGDIGAAVGFKDIKTDTLCDENTQLF